MDTYFWTAAFQVIKWWMVYGWWLWAADLEVSWWNWPPGSAISPIWSSPWMSRRRRRCESHKAPDSCRFVRFMDLALSFTKGDQHDVCVYNNMHDCFICNLMYSKIFILPLLHCPGEQTLSSPRWNKEGALQTISRCSWGWEVCLRSRF